MGNVDGSSPRVRGTPLHRSDGGRRRRFIPACAGNSWTRWPWASPSSVHPRVCGELMANPQTVHKNNGSSPRVRGTRVVAAEQPARQRFIPACAGNSTEPSPAIKRQAVHPRVCGELDADDDAAWCSAGSSPRVRGTLPPRICGRRPRRFIPACAGNSPRCGASAPRKFGSSPRVRGTRLAGNIVPSGQRFIPACAGNSPAIRDRRQAAAVHPRVCGELRRRHLAVRARHGSSPRVRGTQINALRQHNQARFIPACAGNSRGKQDAVGFFAGSSPRVRGTRRAPRRFTAPVSVHPRVCGELAYPTQGTGGERSVHPRVCGELQDGRRSCLQIPRFIPACAGNSRGRWAEATGAPVHPRVCGELLARRSAPSATRRFIPACAGNSSWARDYPMPRTGSSPRVRGTRRAAPGRDGRLRFIPACAGNSSAGRPTGSGSSVHPRVCGELWREPPEQVEFHGSSPRVRGTPS